MLEQFLLTLLLVVLNGFFVAAEFAIVKVRHSQIDLRAGQGNTLAKMAQHIVSHLDGYLSACQLGITLASLQWHCVAGWRTTRYLAGQKNLHPSRAPMPDIRSHRCQISGAAIVSGHPHMSQISGWCREESGPLARPDICPHPVPRYPAVCS